MKPDLLGYVLHTLEPAEERAVEEYLESTPEARKELLRMRPLINAMQQDDPEPSKELIYKTLRAIAGRHCAGKSAVTETANALVRGTTQLPKLEPWAIKEY